jgi:hypothetical protein
LLALKLTPEKAFHLNNNLPDDRLSSPSHLVTQNYSATYHSDRVMTSQDQQPIQEEPLRYLPSKAEAEDESDLIIQQEQLKDLNDSSAILYDLREEQKKYSVKLEDAVTLPSNVISSSSAQRQEYLSLLSGTEENANYPFTQIKKDSLDYKVKKVLLIYRQTVADRDEYSLQKSFHTVENVNNSSIIVADNDTASSLHSSQRTK